MDIVWREVAILSLERARAYIAQDNPTAAERVYDCILRSVANLADMPHIGRSGRVEDTRELVEQLVTIAVQHSAQRWPRALLKSVPRREGRHRRNSVPQEGWKGAR